MTTDKKDGPLLILHRLEEGGPAELVMVSEGNSARSTTKRFLISIRPAGDNEFQIMSLLLGDDVAKAIPPDTVARVRRAQSEDAKVPDA